MTLVEMKNYLEELVKKGVPEDTELMVYNYEQDRYLYTDKPCLQHECEDVPEYDRDESELMVIIPAVN